MSLSIDLKKKNDFDSIFDLLKKLKQLLKKNNFKIFKDFIERIRDKGKNIFNGNNKKSNLYNQSLINFLLSINNLLNEFDISMNKKKKKINQFFFKNDFKKKKKKKK